MGKWKNVCLFVLIAVWLLSLLGCSQDTVVTMRRRKLTTESTGVSTSATRTDAEKTDSTDPTGASSTTASIVTESSTYTEGTISGNRTSSTSSAKSTSGGTTSTKPISEGEEAVKPPENINEQADPQKYFVAMINDPLYSQPQKLTEQDKARLGVDVDEMDFYEYWIRYIQVVYPTDLAGKDHEYNMALGIIGPQPLTHSGEEMRSLINRVFDLAEKFDMPVYFQLDDMINYDIRNGNGAPKYYEDPNSVEWYGFPDENNRVKMAKFWFNWSPNWSGWHANPGVPCFNSPTYLKFLNSQMDEIMPTFKERYEKLIKMDKEYLFAGISIGWETRYVDNSYVYELVYTEGNTLPVNNLAPYQTMQAWEMAETGYAALYWLGYDNVEELEQAAQAAGKTTEEYKVDLLSEVQREYSTMLSKRFYDIGIPRNKIFTHIVSEDTLSKNDAQTLAYPRVSTAVNYYSTPGFTMSAATSPYDLDIMKEKIRKYDPTQKYFGIVEGYAQGYREDDHTKDGVFDQQSFDEVTKYYFEEQFEYGCLISAIFGWGGAGDVGNTVWLGCPKDPEDHYNQLITDYLEIRR